MNLWNERVNAEPRPDLISMLAHGEATRNMSAREYLGNVILLIVGGNDRRPRYASLTDRNCEGFSRPGNRVGLLGLRGGAEGIRTEMLLEVRCLTSAIKGTGPYPRKPTSSLCSAISSHPQPKIFLPKVL